MLLTTIEIYLNLQDVAGYLYLNTFQELEIQGHGILCYILVLYELFCSAINRTHFIKLR